VLPPLLASCTLRNTCASGTAPKRRTARSRRLCSVPPAPPAPCQAPGASQQPWLQPRACQPPPAGQAKAAGQHPRAQPGSGAQAACRTSRRAFDGELTLEGLRDGGYFDMPIQVRAARRAGSPVPCTHCRLWCGWRPTYQHNFWRLTPGRQGLRQTNLHLAHVAITCVNATGGAPPCARSRSAAQNAHLVRGAAAAPPARRSRPHRMQWCVLIGLPRIFINWIDTLCRTRRSH